MTGTAALIGSLVGSQIGQFYLKEALAFTSGGFLYFSVNGLLSELKSIDSMLQLFYCFLSMSLGLYTMYVFALFE
jgi:zinc transporter ZupT